MHFLFKTKTETKTEMLHRREEMNWTLGCRPESGNSPGCAEWLEGPRRARLSFEGFYSRASWGAEPGALPGEFPDSGRRSAPIPRKVRARC